MSLSLSLMLGRNMALGSLDPDAKSYIAAVRAAGATVSGAQSTAISNFIITEKAASRWTGLKRFYLPIWGVAAANAIDMKGLGSGTFVGGVTHAAGYVQGNGTTGYFDSGVSITGLGTTGESLLWGGLVNQASSNNVARGIAGAYESETAGPYFGISTNLNSRMYSNTSQITGALQTTGIILGGREGGRAVIRHRGASGYQSLTSTTVAINGTLPTRTIVFMAINDLFWFNNARFGVFFASTGATSSESEQFTLSVKTLWETCTGLTLP